MRSIADDYEEIEMIEREVTAWAAERGFAANSLEVVTSLTGLIESGLAKAHRLAPGRPAEQINGVPDREILPDCYFRLTAEGVEMLRVLLPQVLRPEDSSD